MDYRNHYNIKRRSSTKTGSGGKRSSLRLWSCIVIFAMAVCVRAIAPQFSRSISETVLRTIDRDVDYHAAFGAVGSFVSGERTLSEAVAVIKGAGEEAAPAAATLPTMSGAAQHNLQSMYLQCLEADMAAEPAMAEGTGVIYEAEESLLPDNVCAELVELPFDYSRPVAGAQTSKFGYREHPIDGVNKFHYGNDFMADEGEDIFAFADGHIAASGKSQTAGNYLIISHGNGWTTQYFHCSKIYATSGSPVKRGDVIAAAGHTGAATGPHLHFELIRDGVYHDPGLYINEQG